MVWACALRTGRYSPPNTKEMCKLARARHASRHARSLYVEGSSPLFHGPFLLISHTAMNLRSQAPKSKLAALLLYTYRYNKQCNVMGNKASYWKWPRPLCTLHSLRIQMSAAVLCLMCQIRVAIPSAVCSPHAGVCKLQKTMRCQGGSTRPFELPAFHTQFDKYQAPCSVCHTVAAAS